MTHKIKALVPVEKRTLFGKRTVYEYKTVTVDGKTYRKMQREQKNCPFGIGEMMFYDTIWGD